MVPPAQGTMTIGASYQQYTVLFRARVTATDARITFGLGIALPAGKDFYLDTLSLQACKPNDGVALMDNDVGNIIYNNDAGAYKRFVLTDQGSSPDYYHTGLHNQGDFYYNPGNWTVQVYSTSNPAGYYSDVEVARSDIIIVGGSYVTISNLAAQYGSASGFCFASQHDFTVSHCDLSWIGGSEQGSVDGNGNPVRFGDGFATLYNLSNVLIEDCRVWQIYDAPFGNQGFGGPGSIEYHLSEQRYLGLPWRLWPVGGGQLHRGRHLFL